MRQLLSRKSNAKMNEDDSHNHQSRTSRPGTALGAPDAATERSFSPRSPQTNGSGFSVGANGTFRQFLVLREESKKTNKIEKRYDQTSLGGEEQRKVSERSQYTFPKGAAPRVYAGSNGTAVYRRCEDEPIHTPGTIQSFGALIGLRYSNSGNLEVRIASENTRKILGYGPEQLFALPNFLEALKSDVRTEMVARVNAVLSDLEAGKEETRLDVFQIAISFPYEPEIHLWCALHLAPNQDGLVIAEFEEYRSTFFFKDLNAAKLLPLQPASVMDFDVSQEDFDKSTTMFSKPLPVLEIARQKENKEFTSLDLFTALTQAQHQIYNCKSVQHLQEVLVGIVAELTGFHRVMSYRFDDSSNGAVEAEFLNPAASSDLFRGLHFPASDIPVQARELYKKNRIRLLFDRDAETARLVCRNDMEFPKPLDLTHAYLRSLSPIHNKYLANLGVRSTMSISIVIDEKLWGLVACHGYGDFGTRISLPLRELCRNIGECAAINIQRLLLAERCESRKRRQANPSIPAAFQPSTAGDMLKLFDADFALLSVDDSVRPIGPMENHREAISIMSYLQTCKFAGIKSSSNIKADFPGMVIPVATNANTIAGLLFVPLNPGSGNDFIVFFRKVLMRHVKWAGNPNDKKFTGTGEYLEPRSSFKRWAESIVGTSKPWTDEQLDTASILALLYGRFVEFWSKDSSASQPPSQTADHSQQMSLIRASSRDCRGPLDMVNQYLDAALKQKIDDKTRDLLVRAKGSSKSLVYVVDDIMRLSATDDEESSTAVASSASNSSGPSTQTSQPPQETFSLASTASRVLKALQKEAARKSVDLSISAHDSLPSTVKGDGERFKQVLVYFVRNAFKAARSAKADVTLLRTDDDLAVISLRVQDAGPGMSEVELDDTFAEFEAAQNDESWPLRPKSPGTTDLNVGEVARYVKSVNGQILVSSELGKGTIFSVELPYEMTTAEKSKKLRNIFMPSRGSSKAAPTGNLKNLKAEALEVRRVEIANPGGLEQINEYQQQRSGGHERASPRVPNGNGFDYGRGEAMSTHSTLSNDSGTHLTALVADSDPMVLRTLDETLSQWGHNVEIATDGQDCHDRFAMNPAKIDVVLMDLKLSVVDGVLSTRMIRMLERETRQRDPSGSGKRVPIIAVSSSLTEDNRNDLLQTGFDGWLLKPIDFRRMDRVLQGVKNSKAKREGLFVPGQGEKGGWFLP